MCLTHIDEQLNAIFKDPDDSTHFAWGHPYKRWTSFLPLDPSEDLLHSKARIYWTFGTADDSTPPLSAEVALAKLRAQRRDVTVRRVADANHMLMNPSNPDISDMDREFRAALAWFWKASGR